MKGIGQSIRKARLKLGLTQKQLGDLCGMADSAIRRYELEKLNPKFETIQKIANALGVSPLYLMEGNAEDAYPGIFRVPHTIAIDTDKINKELGIDEAEEDRINQLVDAFLDLNEGGQQKAIERVEELAEIPKYKKEEPPQD